MRHIRRLIVQSLPPQSLPSGEGHGAGKQRHLDRDVTQAADDWAPGIRRGIRAVDGDACGGGLLIESGQRPVRPVLELATRVNIAAWREEGRGRKKGKGKKGGKLKKLRSLAGLESICAVLSFKDKPHFMLAERARSAHASSSVKKKKKIDYTTLS